MVRLLNLSQIIRAKQTDIQDLQREVKETRELCRKLDLIIEKAPDGLYVTDGDANAIRINSAFARISGLDREKMLGVNHRLLEEKRIVYQSSALKAIRERRPVTIIHEYLPTNKQALVTSIPVYDEHENIEMVVSSTRDLTELNDVKSKLAAERECRLHYEQQIEMFRAQVLADSDIIAVDKKTLDLLQLCKRIAKVDSTVLITGETGVGKEALAKYIYKNSNRSKEPFITLNCSAIPKDLVESELFGYEKGAFTGALQSGKKGIFELSDKGTVFLDEVGELPLETQAKLLRALESRTIVHVGGGEEIPIDVRIISATNRDLPHMVEEKEFRSDLYYRLNVVPICIPPLRERRDDIVPLTTQFLKDVNKKYGMHKDFTQAAFRALLQYDWPGNVRELKNIIERMVVTSDADLITVEDLPMGRSYSWQNKKLQHMPMKERLERIEYTFMKEALDTYGSIRQAAKKLQMTVPTFIRKKKKYERLYSDSKME